MEAASSATILTVALTGYLLPGFLGASRNHHNKGANSRAEHLAWLEFLGGVIALVWASTTVKTQQQQ